MEESYILDITPRALNYIRENIIPPNSSNNLGLVIYSLNTQGGGYEIHECPISKLRSITYYIPLFSKDYHNHGFEIYIEGLIIREHYLPNPMVLDLITKLNGELMLDIKNPAFET